MESEFIEVYKRCKNFHQAVIETGIRPLVAHALLLRSGLLKRQDKVNYKVRNFIGGEAEEFFQKLVPKAVNTNVHLQSNNPVSDFMYRGLTINVKFSSYLKNKSTQEHRIWKFQTYGCRKELDLFVAFCERDVGTKLNNPYCLLIPSYFVQGMEQLRVFKHGKWFDDFRIELDELKNILDMYAEALGE